VFIECHVCDLYQVISRRPAKISVSCFVKEVVIVPVDKYTEVLMISFDTICRG